MNADMLRSLQRSWVLARLSRAVDKQGLAAALTFLVAMFFGVQECSGKTTEQDTPAASRARHNFTAPYRSLVWQWSCLIRATKRAFASVRTLGRRWHQA